MANEWLRYANQGATRNQQLNADLVNALSRFAPQMGLQVEVFSGGQPGKGSGGARVGSVRHDHGGAADVFFHKDGRRLDWANSADLPIFQDIVRQGRAAGLTGFGAGDGYMQPGSMHVGFGNPGVWGAGGQGSNAPDWLKTAFNGATGGAQPTMANMQNGSFDPVGEVMAAATKPAAGTSLASFYGAPGATTSMAGKDPLTGMGAAPPGFGSLALLFAQQQAAQQQRRADEQAAEETRRAALFAPDSLATLFG